jgi:uncharacterized membrane protein
MNSTVAGTTPSRSPHDGLVKTVTVDRSGEWLAAGWRDLMNAKAVGLSYGAGFIVVSYVLTIGLIELGYGSLVLPLFGAFLLVAPIQVVGLYDVSRRLEQGLPVSFASAWAACKSKAHAISAMGVVFLVFALAWKLIALLLFAIFFHDRPPQLDQMLESIVFAPQGALFLGVGTAIGAVLASVLFAISAVSVPMLMDRDIDVVTAITISMRVVRANFPVMIGWAAMIVVMTFAGIVTFFIGFAVVLPVLAFATWHAYRDTVDTRAI